MAFLERDIKVDVTYDIKTAYEAAKIALLKLGFEIRSENEAAHLIQANVKMTFTGGSWGDILTIAIESGNNGSQVTVKSAAKAPSLLAGNKQAKNIETFLSCYTEVLQEFDEVTLDDAAPVADVVTEIKRYKELLDIGAITEEEFAKKKQQLLGL